MQFRTLWLEEDGFFPNNTLPVIIYPSYFQPDIQNIDQKFMELINENNWGNVWKDGIFPYQHYHSTAHELIAVYKGFADVQLGGPVKGVTVHLQAGDAVILPAGVAHKNIDSSPDFACIGAYPAGQDYDMKYGEEDEYHEAVENIKQVPLPETDPLLGNEGAVIEKWKPK